MSEFEQALQRVDFTPRAAEAVTEEEHRMRECPRCGLNHPHAVDASLEDGALAHIYNLCPNLPITAETMDQATDAIVAFCMFYGARHLLAQSRTVADSDRLVEMAMDAWAQINRYTDMMEKTGGSGLRAVTAQVDAIDLVNWCSTLAALASALKTKDGLGALRELSQSNQALGLDYYNTAPPLEVSDVMADRAMDAYVEAANSDGYSSPNPSLRAIHLRWLRAALTAALTPPSAKGE